MTRPVPLLWAWDGEHMTPYQGKLADQRYVIGERYWLEEVSDRSTRSHKHYFAWLRTAWINLPERMAKRMPHPENMRHKALIEAGYYDETIIDAGTREAALRVAMGIRRLDHYAHVVVRGQFVAVRQAQSQSYPALKGKAFEVSKQAVMEVIAAWIGLTIEEIDENLEAAA